MLITEASAAVRVILWWAESGPAVRMRPAARALHRQERIASPAQSSIPVGLSVSTVRRQTVCITAITSVRQSMWTSGAAAPATAERLPARPLRRDKIPVFC